MVNAILLQSGSLRDFQTLGSEGNPVYQSAPQLRAAIRRTLGEDVSDAFAVPQLSEDGSRIGWYAPQDGDVVPWSSATPEEQRETGRQLLDVRERIQETSRLMQVEHDSERQVFGRLLQYVTRVPGDSHIYLVDGRPVLTFWGFLEHGARSDYDALLQLPIPEPAAAPVVPSTSVTTLADAVPQEDSGRGWRFNWWWLLLPLLLLLLLLGLFLLRGCLPGSLPGTGLPEFGLPDSSGSGHDIKSEQEPVVENTPAAGVPDGLNVDSGSALGRGDASSTWGADSASTEGDWPAESPEGGLIRDDQKTLDANVPEELPGEEEGGADLSDDQSADEQPGEDLSAEDQPVQEQAGDEPTESLPSDGQTAEDQPLAPPPVPDIPQATQGNNEPLVIPPEAVKMGSTDFLNGRWSADSGLMDRSGRPVGVEYEFNKGKGVARYRRSNGVVCEGLTSAAMEGSRLVITDGENIVCQDGVRFRKSRVECQVGEGGLADCTGSYVTGDRFSVEMNKAKKN